MFRRISSALAVAVSTTLIVAGCVAGEGANRPSSAPEGSTPEGNSLEVLRLDYAYWNPLSLVLRDQGWLEEELGEQGVAVEWILSAGSSKALENLNANAIDIGSSAGSAVFAARANGAPLKTVGVFSQPYWASLVVANDSPITSLEDLAGTTIAAASGTDPYFFLLQALAEVGLSSADVEVVNLIHGDGQKALESGDVDVWAGLDPLTATSERTAGTRILYANPDYNTWGVLSTTESFLAEHPDTVAVVLAAYERARQWVADNEEQAVQILATEASLDIDDARKVLLERTELDVSLVPGGQQLAVFEIILPVLVAEARVRTEEDGQRALLELIDDTLAKQVVGQ
jgi:sulfonate transport system substrate-binding protein